MEVKERLISKIKEIEDEGFLNELEQIVFNLHTKNTKVYELSDEMHESLNFAEADVAYNRTVTHENLMNELKQWIAER